MASILVPGYLRWDGTKFVLDEDIEIIGPTGPAGPEGPDGPAGPPGPSGVASGDLSGNYPGPIAVVGLTGVSGILPFGISVPNPTITQTSTGGTTGQTMTLKAQPATLFGGNLTLQSGTGTTAGIITFLVGNTTVGQFDSAFRFRVGPNSSNTFNVFTSTPYPAATHYIYSNNAAGRNSTGTFSGAANDFAAVEALNYSAGSNATTGVRLFAAGATYTGVPNWQSHGAIDQVGNSNSALVFTSTDGASGTNSVRGRIWQSGAWTLGPNFSSSSSAQAGVSGTVLQFTPSNFTATPTTTSDQAIIFNQWTGIGNIHGQLALQGNIGVNLMSGTVSVANTSTTKFITNVGRRKRLINSTTTPVTMTASDHVVSIGTITTGTVATTIAAGSNGLSLPQATINVVSTTGFAASGAIFVLTNQGAQLVTYTGTTGTTFTGCSGGTGQMSTGGTVNALFTVNLPATPASGDTCTVKDANGSAGQNNIAIIGNGNNIDGVSGLVITINYTAATFIYNGTSWTSSFSNNISPGAGYTSVVNVVSGGTANVVGFDQLLLCDPTSASCTVQAPANPTINMRFTVKDATNTAAGPRPIIVQGNGRTLENPTSPGTYASPINITTASLSATWAFDPTRNRYTLVSKV
jgi:hypothetical protein